MDANKDIKPLKRQFDFSDVPSWYVLCTNNLCPMQTSCLRFLAAQHAPDNLEIARCVMKKDYTSMRKGLTSYLHGVKFYYEYKRGDRPLSPEQQQWIRQFVKSYGYDWEVPFDSYYEASLA